MKRFVVLVALLVSSGYTSAGRTLTLEECRELAIQNNKELKISGEKIKMAGYEKNAAFTKYFPQLSATGAYMWNQKISICWIWEHSALLSEGLSDRSPNCRCLES